VFCLSLDCDLKQLVSLAEADLQTALALRPSPFAMVRVTGAPTITALFEASDEMLNGQEHRGVGRNGTSAFEMTHELCRRLTNSYVATRKVWPLSPYVEQQLYSGLTTWEDERLCAKFHEESLSAAYS